MTQYSDEDLLNAAAGLYGIVHVRQLTDILRRYGGQPTDPPPAGG